MHRVDGHALREHRAGAASAVSRLEPSLIALARPRCPPSPGAAGARFLRPRRSVRAASRRCGVPAEAPRLRRRSCRVRLRVEAQADLDRDAHRSAVEGYHPRGRRKLARSPGDRAERRGCGVEELRRPCPKPLAEDPARLDIAEARRLDGTTQGVKALHSCARRGRRSSCGRVLEAWIKAAEPGAKWARAERKSRVVGPRSILRLASSRRLGSERATVHVRSRDRDPARSPRCSSADPRAPSLFRWRAAVDQWRGRGREVALLRP